MIEIIFMLIGEAVAENFDNSTFFAEPLQIDFNNTLAAAKEDNYNYLGILTIVMFSSIATIGITYYFCCYFSQYTVIPEISDVDDFEIRTATRAANIGGYVWYQV